MKKLPMYCPTCRATREIPTFTIASRIEYNCSVCGQQLEAPEGKILGVIQQNFECFTHIDTETREVRCFNATEMLAYAMSRAQSKNPRAPGRLKQNTPMPPGVALVSDYLNPRFAKWILDGRSIDSHRVARLCDPYLSTPIIGCIMPDGTTLTVDGHHRYVRLTVEAARLNLHPEDPRWRFQMLRFDAETWARFLVDVPADEKAKIVAEIEAEERAAQQKGAIPP